jgi:hypothetical protein
MCLCQTVINVGAQCLQRYLALDLFFRASNFRTTQTPTNDHFNTLGIRTHGFLHSLLHRSTERDALLQLLRNAATHQICIELRLADLSDLQTHTLLGLPLKHGSQLIDFLAALANDNTRFGCMNNHKNLVSSGALDANARNGRIRQLFVNEVTNLEILSQDIFIITLGIPARLPALNDAEPEPCGMHFVSQKCPPS